MKKRAVFMAFLLIPLVMLLSPLAALAENGTSAQAVRPELKGALAIVAPLTVAAGNEFSLRVFDRRNQEPVPGVRVWALTEEQAKVLKEEAKSLSDNKAAEKDYETLADSHGIPLGKTGPDGRLHPVIKEAGRYILLAAMKGYVPGFSPIAVRAVLPALAVQAPKAVAVGKEAVITVTQRGTDSPICGASVYALTRAQAEALKNEIASLRQGAAASADKDYGAVVSGKGGVAIGQTGSDGKLQHTFTVPGGYALVAVKKGYVPGVAAINIVAPAPTPAKPAARTPPAKGTKA